MKKFINRLEIRWGAAAAQLNLDQSHARNGMHNQMWFRAIRSAFAYAFVGTLPPSMHVIHIASIRWHSEIPRARKDMYCRDGLVVFLYYPAAAKVISADVLSR